MERVMGIEPTQPAWKAGILPLNYTRISRRTGGILRAYRKTRFAFGAYAFYHNETRLSTIFGGIFRISSIFPRSRAKRSEALVSGRASPFPAAVTDRRSECTLPRRRPTFRYTRARRRDNLSNPD